MIIFSSLGCNSNTSSNHLINRSATNSISIIYSSLITEIARNYTLKPYPINSIINKQMAIITYSGSNYIYDGNIVYQELRDYILSTFGLKEGEFNIVYLDEEGDHITLGTKDDYEIVNVVQESSGSLNLIVTSTKKETLKLESPIEITIPEEGNSPQVPEAHKAAEEADRIRAQLDEEDRLIKDAEMKRIADMRTMQAHRQAERQARMKAEQDARAKWEAETKAHEEELIRRTKQQAEKRRIQKQTQKNQAERLKAERMAVKKAQDEERDRLRREKDQEKMRQRQERERKRQEKKEQQHEQKRAKNQKSNEKSEKVQKKPKEVEKVQKSDEKVQKEQAKKSPKKQEKKETLSEKIGEWDINKLNEVVEQRLKNLIPTLKKQIEKEIKSTCSESNSEPSELFTIGLEYPQTPDDVTRMKNQAFEKVKAFYQAENLKINEKLKEQKLRLAALEKERKKKQEKQTKERELKEKIEREKVAKQAENK